MPAWTSGLAELESQRAHLDELRAKAREGTVTIVYGARDSEHSNAAVMVELLNGSSRGRSRKRS
jgi:uncharacterized protein YeaO (DUF488 family)